MAADLRDAMVPCGDCEFEEDLVSDKITGHSHETPKHVTDSINRNTMGLEALQIETTRAIATLGQSMLHIRETNEHQTAAILRIETMQRDMATQIGRYNNMRERLDQIEAETSDMHEKFVGKEVFNGAMESIRKQLGLVQWAFGLGFSSVVTLLVLILTRGLL